MSQDFLATMAASSRARVAAARAVQADAELWRWAEASPPPPPLYLSPEGFDVIAEVKLRSPAVGQLRDSGDEDVVARVKGYAAAGAAAVSVLTEPERFEGSLDHLEQASRALLEAGRVPAMRKDFLVDPYQVAEARLAGAGGILIIVRMLDRPQLDALLKAARHFGLFVLIEAFDAADIRIAAELVEAHAGGPPLLVGINSRDLVSLKVVPGRLEELVGLLPRGVPRVAESGVGSPEDAARLARAGYELALIGSALMTTDDPVALLKAMIAAGRGAR
ncbi:MAG: indole-3-glycerol-phosphate synthase [Proteobacteria bacterium]|nr:indole-3-glycerol-phosphate synthase [Pseudomonadota bacterium]MBK7117282.1 indole-3-glycerol-phosphate synthase [Pseudomonadota bacterium]MBK9250398.1 indole-3-glycerol-phosphate synthase [Pseudomonadota bacterium]